MGEVAAEAMTFGNLRAFTKGIKEATI